jgi:fucose permease
LIGNFVGIVAISLTANEAVLWVGTAVMGLSQASIFPTLLSFVEQHMTITARASSWFFVFVGGSGIATPPIIGYLIDNVDPRAMMWAILGYTILAMGVFSYILQRFPEKEALYTRDRIITEKG